MVAIVFHSFFDGSNYLQPLTTPRMWLFAIMLASFSPRKIVSFIGHVVHTVPVRRK